MSRIKHWLVPFGFGLLGVAVALGLWHWWTDHRWGHEDHQRVDILWNIEVQREQAAQKGGGS